MVERMSFFNHNRQYHNINDPAVITYNSGFVINESYYLNGKKHNPIGPAIRLKFSLNGCWTNSYYINDKYITKEIFINNLEKRLGL
jgi:hypothetical protein